MTYLIYSRNIFYKKKKMFTIFIPLLNIFFFFEHILNKNVNIKYYTVYYFLPFNVLKMNFVRETKI